MQLRRDFAAGAGRHQRNSRSKGTRDLAMFNLSIDSKLRGCDVVAMRVEDVCWRIHSRPRNGKGKPDGLSGLN
jgi:hypothetical protein